MAMPKVTITRESVIQIIEQQHVKSVSAIYKSLGGTGNVSGSTAKKIRELVPDVAARLAANKSDSSATPSTLSATDTAAKKPTVKKTGKAGKYPRAEGNPFREGGIGGYHRVYDILAAHPKGLPRQKLVEIYSAVSRKNLTKSGFDVSVVLSAKDSPTGPRHRSCQEGFFCERENEFVRLRTA